MVGYRTACGGTIIVPPKAEDHLRAHPEVGVILAEVIGRVMLPRDCGFLAVAVNMGRVVGRSGCVKAPRVGFNDPAKFALRVGREKPSRVIVGVEGPEVTTVVILAFPAKELTGTYVLVTAFVGELAPKEPWDRNLGSELERQESLEFWSTHALVFDASVMGGSFESSWGEILGS